MLAPAALANTPLLTNHTIDPATEAKVRLLLDRSRKAYERGDIILAITEAKTAVAVSPISGPARLQLGICLMQAGDAYNAEDQLRRARFDEVPDAQVLPHLFEAMLARGEFEQLLDEFSDPGTPPQGPDPVSVLRARAVAFQGIGKPQDANASMDRSLALLHDRKGIIVRANIALDQGDTKLAKSLSDEVLAANPNDAESLDLRVRTALAMNDLKLALQTADTLVNLNPRSLNSRLTRIGVYFAANMDDKAKPEVEFVGRQYPTLLIVSFYRAMLLARTGDAAAAWKLAITFPMEFNTSNPDVGENVAEMAAQSGHLEPAAAILHAVIAKWPNAIESRLDLVAIRLRQKNPTDALSVLLPLDGSNDPVVAMFFARAYTALHRPSDAKKYLAIVAANGGAAVKVTMTSRRAAEFAESWLAVHPYDNRARQQYAQLLMTLGRNADARVQYELLLRGAPADISTLNNLAWLLQDTDPHRALVLLKRALALAPDQPSLLDTQGWIEFRQKDRKDGLMALERAHTLRPESQTIAYHYAEVLNASGRKSEAKSLLEAALADKGAPFSDRPAAERLLASIH